MVTVLGPRMRNFRAYGYPEVGKNKRVSKAVRNMIGKKSISNKSVSRQFDYSLSKLMKTLSQAKEHQRMDGEGTGAEATNTSKRSKRKRLDGVGRQVSNPDFDVELALWIREKRENKQPMSR
uniref:Uncharacterized protein n=1 Tax=Ditylenchus dipsaci TaxID=166011 RepID=A0A915DH40_9BILA